MKKGPNGDLLVLPSKETTKAQLQALGSDDGFEGAGPSSRCALESYVGSLPEVAR